MAAARVADRYTLDHEVGRGACGAVWAATDEILDRTVAIKRVGPVPGGDQTETIRAEREARLAAQVSHPHVISVFDLVHDEDHHWLVMEYVDGSPLSALIKERGPLPPDDLAAMIAPVADALAFAHDVGIVHRDVKPSNILVRRDGEAKLTDFGIARTMQDATLTQTGAVTGSPAYLAPEVATGGSATPASDVWSFGATLYHALAGRPPYHREDEDNAVLAVLYRIVHEEPPRLPSAGWLAPLLEMTLTHDPAGRPSMAEVRDFLYARTPDVSRPTLFLPSAESPAPEELAGSPGLATVAVAAGTVETRRPPVAQRGARSRRNHPPRRAVTGLRRTVVVAAAVATVLLVTGLTFALGTSDDGGGQSGATAAPSDTVPASGSDEPSPTEPFPQATDDAASDEAPPQDDPTTDAPPTYEPPTAAELRDFARTYVRTAERNPTAGFRMLTPGYQNRSPRYDEFWGSMSNPRILELAADPAAMTVTYTYRYRFPGAGTRTERVTLELVKRDGRLLIADAS
ncbi:protein kinase domain-containing protein [Nocardioides sp. SYSU DS0651]|uniref:serine/threonine-protein kinase n=1 Tax=Nocardioides sp. SYSU DS0651 TaxID=3415955 RepID=UPI003F4C9C16